MSNEIKVYELNDLALRVIAATEKCTSDVVDKTVDKLDTHRGVMLTSRYEYPGRYTRWDIGLVDPPLVVEAAGKILSIKALNERGRIILPVFLGILSSCVFVRILNKQDSLIECSIIQTKSTFMEEERSKLPHVMNVIRHLRDALAIEDPNAGFYGAFGYDLGIDFMGVKRTLARNDETDLVLYFADQLFITDHSNDSSYRIDYDFEFLESAEVVSSTVGIQRSGAEKGYIPAEVQPSRDMPEGGFAQVVESAKSYFARGDLFEVVPSQAFHEPCNATPATVFKQLLELNPAPYGALINLGNNEWTVSASPEMFVRVDGHRVESCPIAGTIARGTDLITDAQQIEILLNSEKEESELTMCTDVDRNDKSRVCIPNTIDVIGRRQIEMYSRLIHTVDHVEGYLEDGYDAIDAFMTHMWAVTVTGAPKMWAMNFIEQFEKSPRRFYGGSMGFVGLNGSMNTGLMLRSIHFYNGAAHMRVGATLLFDSDPHAEEKETELKASAMLDVVRYCHKVAIGENPSNEKMKPPVTHDLVITDKNDEMPSEKQDPSTALSGSDPDNAKHKEVLLIDCEDSFVHTLAGYFRMCGANVHTRRVGFSEEDLNADIEKLNPGLICLSPGPGTPSDFGLSWIIEKSREKNIPIFGVCLGLQAIVEYFGGELDQMETPMHGKPSSIILKPDSGMLFTGIESPFTAGRYHSLFASRNTFPESKLRVTATNSQDDLIMAIEHLSEPIAGVQFHPESIMTMEASVGRQIIQNVIDQLAL